MKPVHQILLEEDERHVNYYDKDYKYLGRSPTEPVHARRWRALFIWVITFSAIALLMVSANRHRVNDNRERINDIQESRVSSCEQTYRTLRRGLKILVPPSERGPRYKRAYGEWDPHKCIKQTKIKPSPHRSR